MELIGTIIVAAGIPSALFAAFLRRFEKHRAEEEKARQEKEEARRKYELYLVKMLTATACLCEANAIALQNGKCNGETHSALDHLKEVKHDQRDFLMEQGLDHLFNAKN